MQLKLKTSLVILSYKRPLAIKRYISYLSNFSIDVVIMDGSPNKLLKQNQINFGNASINYVHMPSEGNNYIERLIKGLTLVKTKYFCLMDDSDMVIPGGIREIEKWLEKNNNYMAGGDIYNLTIDKPIISLQKWGRWATPLKINNLNPIDRLQLVFDSNRFANLMYVVIPAKQIKLFITGLEEAQKISKRHLINNVEEVISTINLRHLRFKKLEVPFWIRCKENYFEDVHSHTYVNDSNTITNVRKWESSDSDFFKKLTYNIYCSSYNFSYKKFKFTVASIENYATNFSKINTPIKTTITRAYYKQKIKLKLNRLKSINSFVSYFKFRKKMAKIEIYKKQNHKDLLLKISNKDHIKRDIHLALAYWAHPIELPLSLSFYQENQILMKKG